MKLLKMSILIAVLIAMSSAVAFAQETEFLRINAASAEERALVANLGASIESVNTAGGYIIAEVPDHRMEELRATGLAFEPVNPWRDMPADYEAYHDYAEQVQELRDLAAAYPDLTWLKSIGTTYEGRELWSLKISDRPEWEETDEGAILIVAQHHAREILSPEVALYTARTLLENYDTDEMIRALVDNREIYIIPTLNPDGAEFDQAQGSFKLWRKNRSPNGNWPAFCSGADLNRNYGYKWGGVGSTGFPCDLTFHGSEAFSELETQALRDFVLDHENIRVLITLHTYSELVLWPWSYTYNPINEQVDRAVFERLGRVMAEQNGYTAQQSSKLYPTTGDTTDWAYGELGIFAYTFELSPSDMLGGGTFYPPSTIIPKTVSDNFNALLPAIGLASDPYRALSAELWKLEATRTENEVVVEWASILETNAAGWNVLRADETNRDRYIRVNTAVIPAGQAEYSFTDSSDLDPTLSYFYAVQFDSSENASYDQRFVVEAPALEEGVDDDSDASNDDDAADIGDDDDDDDSGGGCGF